MRRRVYTRSGRLLTRDEDIEAYLCGRAAGQAIAAGQDPEEARKRVTKEEAYNRGVANTERRIKNWLLHLASTAETFPIRPAKGKPRRSWRQREVSKALADAAQGIAEGEHMEFSGELA